MKQRRRIQFSGALVLEPIHPSLPKEANPSLSACLLRYTDRVEDVSGRVDYYLWDGHYWKHTSKGNIMNSQKGFDTGGMYVREGDYWGDIVSE